MFSIFRQAKWAYQKIMRGYSDPETWSVDYTIAKKALPLLIHLRNHTHGVPVSLYSEEDLAIENDGAIVDKYTKIWDDILDKIIFAMKYALCDMDGGKRYKKFEAEVFGEDFDIGSIPAKENGSFDTESKEWKQYRAILKRAADRATEGARLFGKHFFDLWD